jgi:hypothetical protein
LRRIGQNGTGDTVGQPRRRDGGRQQPHAFEEPARAGQVQGAIGALGQMALQVGRLGWVVAVKVLLQQEPGHATVHSPSLKQSQEFSSGGARNSDDAGKKT